MAANSNSSDESGGRNPVMNPDRVDPEYRRYLGWLVNDARNRLREAQGPNAPLAVEIAQAPPPAQPLEGNGGDQEMEFHGDVEPGQNPNFPIVLSSADESEEDDEEDVMELDGGSVVSEVRIGEGPIVLPQGEEPEVTSRRRALGKMVNREGRKLRRIRHFDNDDEAGPSRPSDQE